MQVTHLTERDHVVSQWSGGRTAQIAIAPAGAVYAQRDFLWRISSATVEGEESDFTPLPEYDRWITTLEGGITLTHDGGAPVVLAPLEVHAFDGGSATHSLGRCVDFNLMLRKGRCRGWLWPVRCREDLLPDGAGADVLLLYCVHGAGALTCGPDRWSLAAGESLLLRSPEAGLALESGGEDRFLLAAVWEKP